MVIDRMGSKKVWIIGARDTCDIVIDQPTVSGEHCRLEFDDGRVFIEDLQSTNGTFVNGERIFKKKQIHPDALVTLGKSVTMPMPSQLSGPKEPPKKPAQPAPPTSTDDDAPFPATLLIASGIGATVALLLVLFLVLVFSSGSTGEEDVASVNDPIAEEPEVPKPTTPATTSTKPTTTVAQKPVEPPPVTHSPQEAIYVLAVTDASNTQRYRIGTGVAIGPNTILTSATVKTISDLAKERFPRVTVLGDRPLTVTQFVPHPTYLTAMQEGDEAEAKFHTLFSKVDMNDISADLRKTVEDTYRHYMIYAEKPHHYDVAIIQVQQKLPYWLPLAKDPTLPPLSKLTVVGHGFDRMAPYYPPGSALPLSEVTARVQKASGEAGNQENARLLVARFDAVRPQNHLETNWNGSALLNSQGELIGIYSRLTPEMTLGSPPTGETFDASVIADLQPFIRQFSTN
ncbi:FHA domain-containing protein [Bremerella cremea]|uniref:FHA domain-containing protein n=1 Tax=Bremerella cremea TaxID=1031537 RepID=UPI0031EEED1C